MTDETSAVTIQALARRRIVRKLYLRKQASRQKPAKPEWVKLYDSRDERLYYVSTITSERHYWTAPPLPTIKILGPQDTQPRYLTTQEFEELHILEPSKLANHKWSLVTEPLPQTLPLRLSATKLIAISSKLKEKNVKALLPRHLRIPSDPGPVRGKVLDIRGVQVAFKESRDEVASKLSIESTERLSRIQVVGNPRIGAAWTLQQAWRRSAAIREKLQRQGRKVVNFARKHRTARLVPEWLEVYDPTKSKVYYYNQFKGTWKRTLDRSDSQYGIVRIFPYPKSQLGEELEIARQVTRPIVDDTAQTKRHLVREAALPSGVSSGVKEGANAKLPFIQSEEYGGRLPCYRFRYNGEQGAGYYRKSNVDDHYSRHDPVFERNLVMKNAEVHDTMYVELEGSNLFSFPSEDVGVSSNSTRRDSYISQIADLDDVTEQEEDSPTKVRITKHKMGYSMDVGCTVSYYVELTNNLLRDISKQGSTTRSTKWMWMQREDMLLLGKGVLRALRKYELLHSDELGEFVDLNQPIACMEQERLKPGIQSITDHRLTYSVGLGCTVRYRVIMTNCPTEATWMNREDVELMSATDRKMLYEYEDLHRAELEELGVDLGASLDTPRVHEIDGHQLDYVDGKGLDIFYRVSLARWASPNGEPQWAPRQELLEMEPRVIQLLHVYEKEHRKQLEPLGLRIETETGKYTFKSVAKSALLFFKSRHAAETATRHSLYCYKMWTKEPLAALSIQLAIRRWIAKRKFSRIKEVQNAWKYDNESRVWVNTITNETSVTTPGIQQRNRAQRWLAILAYCSAFHNAIRIRLWRYRMKEFDHQREIADAVVRIQSVYRRRQRIRKANKELTTTMLRNMLNVSHGALQNITHRISAARTTAFDLVPSTIQSTRDLIHGVGTHKLRVDSTRLSRYYLLCQNKDYKRVLKLCEKLENEESGHVNCFDLLCVMTTDPSDCLCGINETNQSRIEQTRQYVKENSELKLVWQHEQTIQSWKEIIMKLKPRQCLPSMSPHVPISVPRIPLGWRETDDHAGQTQHPEWVKLFDTASGCYYYLNNKTFESSWEEPAGFQATPPGSVAALLSPEVKAALTVQNAFRANRARVKVRKQRAINVAATGESGSNWVLVNDPSSGCDYYYNTETDETSWEMPDEFECGEQGSGSHAGKNSEVEVTSANSQTSNPNREGNLAEHSSRDQLSDASELTPSSVVTSQAAQVSDALQVAQNSDTSQVAQASSQENQVASSSVQNPSVPDAETSTDQVISKTNSQSQNLSEPDIESLHSSDKVSGHAPCFQVPVGDAICPNSEPVEQSSPVTTTPAQHMPQSVQDCQINQSEDSATPPEKHIGPKQVNECLSKTDESPTKENETVQPKHREAPTCGEQRQAGIRIQAFSRGHIAYKKVLRKRGFARFKEFGDVIPGSKWISVYQPQQKKVYYYNIETGEECFKTPFEFRSVCFEDVLRFWWFRLQSGLVHGTTDEPISLFAFEQLAYDTLQSLGRMARLARQLRNTCLEMLARGDNLLRKLGTSVEFERIQIQTEEILKLQEISLNRERNSRQACRRIDDERLKLARVLLNNVIASETYKIAKPQDESTKTVLVGWDVKQSLLDHLVDTVEASTVALKHVTGSTTLEHTAMAPSQSNCQLEYTTSPEGCYRNDQVETVTELVTRAILAYERCKDALERATRNESDEKLEFENLAKMRMEERRQLEVELKLVQKEKLTRTASLIRNTNLRAGYGKWVSFVEHARFIESCKQRWSSAKQEEEVREMERKEQVDDETHSVPDTAQVPEAPRKDQRKAKKKKKRKKSVVKATSVDPELCPSAFAVLQLKGLV